MKWNESTSYMHVCVWKRERERDRYSIVIKAQKELCCELLLSLSQDSITNISINTWLEIHDTAYTAHSLQVMQIYMIIFFNTPRKYWHFTMIFFYIFILFIIDSVWWQQFTDFCINYMCKCWTMCHTENFQECKFKERKS